jgi:hypothetical protein
MMRCPQHDSSHVMRKLRNGKEQLQCELIAYLVLKSACDTKGKNWQL